MIICLCQAVSDAEIDDVIEGGAASVEAVGRACGAGTDCGSCIASIQGRLACAGRSGCAGADRRAGPALPVALAEAV